MSSPQISVIIPAKDAERFIESCLRSVLAQDDVTFEVVVVDDGSSDATVDVASGVEPRSIRVIDGPGRGPGPARNRGVADSVAPLISFIDADDEMMPGRLAWQVDFLERRPDLAAVFGRQELVVEVDETTAAPVLRPDRQFHDPGGLSVISGMFRRSAFEQLGGFDESYFVSEDLDLVFRMREAGLEMAFEDRMVVRRRIHGENLTLTSGPDIRAELLRSISERVASRRAASGSDVPGTPA